MAAFKNAPDDPVHTIATEIISTILGAKTHFLLRTVENALEKICTFSGAEKVRLFSISEGKQYVTILHQWPANPNNNPAEFSVETLEEYLGFCFEDLLEKNTVVLSDPFQNTQFSNPDVRQSTNLQPRTALIFPIASSTGVHGAIVIYGNSGQKIEWSDVIYELLEEISDSLLNATIRLRNEKLKQGSAELEFWKKFQILLDLSEIYSFQLTVSLDKTVSLDFISNNLSSITGHPREKIQTFDSLLKFFNLEYTENLQIILDRLIEKTGIERIVCKSRRHDTVPRWIEITAKSEFNPEKQRITSIYGVVKDISKYKLTEEALQKTNDDLTLAKIRSEYNETLYRIMYNSTPVLMHLTDLDGNLISVNEQWLQTLGYTADEVLGTQSGNYLTPESQIKYKELISELNSHGMFTNVECQAVTKDGKLVDILTGSKILNNSEGKPSWRMTTSLDITDRKKVEEALRLRESYLTAIIENQPGLVWLKDAKSRFLTVNRAFARSCGMENPEELIGKTDFDVWPKEMAEAYLTDDLAVLNSGPSVNVEELIFDNNQNKWFETFKTPVKNANGEIIGTTGYAHDITARKQEQEALHNVQKLESLGILAGGIAHDFNNLLGGIYGFINLAALQTTEKDVSEMLSDALSTINRARSLTQQLLTFSKGGSPIKKVDSLIPFIQNTVKFALSGSRVSCDFNLPDDLWLCVFDKNQIGQVIDNIVINAQQAMPDGGMLFISATNTVISEKSGYSTLKAGNYVKISFTDQGIGIPKEIISRIFDPFFTTKEKGRGLGLATCHSIIHRHDGCLEVDSEPGKGSTFRFFLPATTESMKEQTNKPPKKEKRSGRVIVMDDEEVIRNVVGQMLEALGYTAIFTKNGEEAINKLKEELQAGNTITAMILDLTIPGGLGGEEAIAQIRSIDPDLPVFVASGYATNQVMASPNAYGFTGSICKPFSFHELQDMLVNHNL